MAATSVLIRIIRALPSSPDRGPAPIPSNLRALCTIETAEVDGCTVFTLTPKSGGTGTELIYTHGGAYVHPISSLHWGMLRSLVERTGMTLTVPYYKLGPAGGVPEAYAMLEKVYASVRERAGTTHSVLLAGDSAGGGLALGQAINYRNKGVQAPDAVILISPWVELTMTNPAMPGLARRDPMLKAGPLAAEAKLWTDDLGDPLASPINDSLAGLPPLFIYQGGREIIRPDVEALAKKAEAAGTEVHLYLEPNAYHVWVAIGATPEAKKARADIAARINAFNHPGKTSATS
jgi:monoterpene epsilon-lactone hydrolase